MLEPNEPTRIPKTPSNSRTFSPVHDADGQPAEQLVRHPRPRMHPRSNTRRSQLVRPQRADKPGLKKTSR